MDYSVLDTGGKAKIRQKRILDLEVVHYQLALDRELLLDADADDEEVAVLDSKIHELERAIKLLNDQGE